MTSDFMTAAMTTRLFFADGSSQLVDLSPQQAESPWLQWATPADPTSASFRTIRLKRYQVAVPPKFAGPVESGDVFVDNHEGTRIFAVFVEDGAPWHARFRH